MLLRFINVPEGRETEDLGPFEWVQITYSLVRAGTGGDNEIELANFRFDGRGWDHNGQVWTDVSMFAATPAEVKV